MIEEAKGSWISKFYVDMEQRLNDVLLDGFRQINEDEGLDERFYEFIDSETLEEFLSLMSD